MKHFNYKFILLLLLFIIPLNAVKASSTIVIDCPSKGNPGSTVTCNLSGVSDKYISSLSAKVSVSGDVEFVSFTTNSIWQGNGNNGTIDLYTDANKTGTFGIGTVTLKLKADGTGKTGTVMVSNVVYYDDNFKAIKVADSSKNIKIASTNNNLASLSLSGYNLSPVFNKNVYEYKATVDSDKVVISATLEDGSATISGTGTKNLSYGTNKFSVIVTSEVGTKKEYKLVITRPEKKQEEPKKEEETTLNDDKKTTEEEKKDTEDKKKNNDSKLKSLSIDGYKLDFNSGIYKYSIEVEADVETLKIEANANDSKANVTVVGNEKLEFGENDVVVTVTAEDGSKSTYTIYVTKKSGTCVVKSISILDYDFEFDCNVYDYELEIGFEDSLNIDVIPFNKEALINIYNNDNLEHGDVIEIVINLDGIDYKYNIKILKTSFELEELFNNRQLVFIGVVLVVTSGYFIIRMIVKRRKKMNKKEVYK